MDRRIALAPLTREAFAPFGQVISTEGAPHFPINASRTARYHDLAAIELGGAGARPLISIFRGQPVALPYAVPLLERHPLGSQAFFPLSERPFLVIVAPDEEGRPARPLAFRAAPGQGVNIGMGVWHGVLAPLEAVSDFLVVDRGGPGLNLEEAHLSEPWLIVGPDAGYAPRGLNP
jgi:ureidoglycolate lyase